MYNFRDVTAASGPGDAFLPPEALKLNGGYLEMLIDGYRTLQVSGREALAPEVATYEIGLRDGVKLKYKRYPARTITVKYQLIAPTDAAFRQAYNALGALLDVTDAQLIFKDEPDKYFIGTPSGLGAVEPGTNAVTGEIEFLCADPFKYSTKEFDIGADGTGNTATIDYAGTYKAYPILEATFAEESEPETLTGKGECGYVAFFNENKSIIQLGNPDESDVIDDPSLKDQTLINQKFKTSTAWATAAKNLWTLNSAPFDYQQIGTLGMKQLSGSSYYLGATSYGTLETAEHGASMMRAIPADASGGTSTPRFDLYFTPVFSIGSGQAALQTYGEFALILISADDEKVVRVRLVKNTAGRTATLMLYVGDRLIRETEIDIGAGNRNFGAGAANPVCRVSRSLAGFYFVIGGFTQAYHFAKSSPVPAVTKIAFLFSQYKSRSPLAYNGLLDCRLVKNACDTRIDIPNVFQPNDVVTANCRTGEITRNGMPAPELGALGNDWENFYLTPGQNQIGFSYSDWVPAGYAPKMGVKYREVYL